MKNNADAGKPLILPAEIVRMLRGERGYTENCKDIAELGIYHYQAGKAGQAYEEPDDPDDPDDFSTWAVDTLKRFLLACWEQGRRDAEGATG